MESEVKTNWYVIYTFPNLEKKIHKELEKKSIIAYLPMQRVIRQWSDRKKQLFIPMFPNYVFINTTEKDRGELYNINGVLKFIAFGGKPAVISNQEILDIKLIENTAFEVEPNLIQGDDVMIMEGPFSGLQGKLFSKRGKKRFGIQLKSINQSLSLEINTSCLRKM